MHTWSSHWTDIILALSLLGGGLAGIAALEPGDAANHRFPNRKEQS